MNLSLSADFKPTQFGVSNEPKRSPQTYVHNRVTKSQRPPKRKPSQRAEDRIETKRHLQALANELGEAELAYKIERCHSAFAVLTCGNHVVSTIPNFTCEFRLCPDCARRRSRKIQNKHLPIMGAFLKQNRVEPVHIVLTQKHRVETRKQSIKRLRDAFTKLQRRLFWAEHFKGGIFSIEFTKGKDGLHHTHLHLIAFRSKFFDIALLRDEWLAVTGDSSVLRVDRIADLRKGLEEVAKYISKPLDTRRFEKEDLADFLGLKNMRFFGTFGEYRKFSRLFEPSDNDELPGSEFSHLAEGCLCPICDQVLFEVRLKGKELPDFLRRIEATSSSKLKE